MTFRRGGLPRHVTALAVAFAAAPALAGLTPLSAQAGAAVTITSSSQWGPDRAHFYHFVGEVENTGDTSSKPYNATDIRITASTLGGQAVETADSEAINLGPGQRSPFDIVTAAPCIGCTLSVNFAPTADPPNHKFSITPDPLTVTTDLDGTQHISGTVTNNNTTSADYVNVILTFYSGAHGAGTVVNEDHIFTLNNTTSTLAPGASAPFSVVRTTDEPAYGSVLAIADSPTAPSLPVVTPTPSPFDFGNVHVGDTGNQTLTITNSGNDDLHVTNVSLSGTNASDFALVGGQDTCTGATVSPTAACSVQLSFTPSEIGTELATLTLTDDTANNPDQIAIQGTGQAPDISATGFDFGDTVIGRTAQHAVVVTNTGNADLHVDTANTGVPGSDGPVFTSDASGCANAVAPGKTCSVAVSFSPAVTGPQSTTLTIVALAGDHAFDSPTQVTISGTGTDPTLGVSPSQLDFGSVTPGVSSAGKTVTVSNSGTGNMHVTGAAVSTYPNDYAVSGCTGAAATVAQGSSCTLTIVFTPQGIGDRTDTLTVTADALNSPKTVSLLGRGSGPVAHLSTTSLAFGKVNVGKSSSSQSATLTNTGDHDLILTAVAVTGDYSQNNNCGPLPHTLHHSDSCTATVSFSPTAAGERDGTLSFTDNAAGGHQDVALTGTGVALSSGWQFLGGSLASSPAATSWGSGRLDVFAKGQNGALYHMSSSDGGNTWVFWTNLGGTLSSNPAAASWGPGRIDVFARGQNLQLYHMWTTDGTNFNSWQPLGGSLSSDPSASSWGVGRLDVFARGQDLALYHMYTTDGVNWTGWQKLGGSLSSSAAAVSWGVNRIDVFARGQDRALYHMSSSDGTNFTDWQLLGGSLASDPAASSWGPTRLDIFAKGQDGALYHMSSDDGNAFTGWQSLGGSLSSNPAAASPQQGRVDLFARGQDLALYHMVLTIT